MTNKLSSTEIPKKLIYKVHILDENGNTNKIIIFQGNRDYQFIFNDEQMLENKKNNIEIVKSEQHIHTDDSIHVIKKKIVNELGINNIAYEELYLFVDSIQKINFQQTYKTITNNNKTLFKKNMLGQFLMNIKAPLELAEKLNTNNEYYTYQDLITTIKDFKNEYNISTPLGHEFLSSINLLYSGNPYHILNKENPLFELNSQNIFMNFENHILLDYPNIINNNIYVCTANNLLNYSIRNNLNQEYVVELYFPLLKNQEIFNQTLLNNKREQLIEKNKQKYNENLNKIYQNIDLLHNMYYYNNEIPYLHKGIQNINIIVHPNTELLLPLEFIFKHLHADENMMFIKYNPGPKREHMYRLYANELSKEGKKIPKMSRNQIMNLSKMSGKTKQISIFLNIENDNNIKYFFMDIESNGNIILRLEMKDSINEADLNDLLIKHANRVITNINKIVENIGYKMNLFNNLRDQNNEITNLEYIWKINIKRVINTKEYVNIFKGVFNIISNNLLIFKRVSNYTELDEINTIIAQNYNNVNDISIIKSILTTNFTISEEEAENKIKQFLNDHTYINGRYVNKSVAINVNPGIPCIISENAIINELTINAKEMNSIDYIHALDVYISNLLTLSQYPDQLPIPKNKLLKQMQDVEKIEEIVEIKPEVIPVELKPFALDESPNKQDSPDEDDAFFFESDDDSEDDSSDDDSSDDLNGGGYTGFLQKMKELEPNLFLTKKTGQYEAYSRSCPASISRQPIILTQEEKDNIDKEYPGSYKVALPYSTKENKKYWYICPRYWCIKPGENRPLSEEEVKDGQCDGKIIPKGVKNPPPGHYIYEFTDNKEHKNKDGSYRDFYPGLLDAESHPNHCVPCCFKKFYSEQQINRRKECAIPDDELSGNVKEIYDLEQKDKKVVVKNVKSKAKASQKNILDFNKYPIEKNRWGFLPIPVEMLLQTKNNLYITKNNQHLIQKDKQPLLRYGVEHTPGRQSFIGCIADLYKTDENISIPEMRKIISRKLKIDKFAIAQNGALITIFKDKSTIIEKKDIEKYKTSVIFNTLDTSNKDKLQYMYDVISSYINFKKFINDDDAFIDHTYLWDIVTSKDIGIFAKGINLVILEVLNNDSTNNIQILCPTNSYQKTFYNSDLKTVILIKQEDFFEPVYLYGNTKDNNVNSTHNVIKFFNNNNMPPNLLPVLKNIENNINKFCKPLPSRPNVYSFNEPLPSQKIYDLLILHNFYVVKQILNYNGKTIGFLVSTNKEDNKSVYVPCYPSRMIKNIDITYPDDIQWNNYYDTLTRLNNINSVSNNNIKCKPVIKIVEDDLIIGFLTQTNQFIQLDTYEQNSQQDNLPTIQYSSYKDYYNIDKSFLLSDEIDSVRKNTVQKISLETQLYLAFRSKIRMLLNEYYNVDIYNKLKELINNQQHTYKYKLDKIKVILKHLVRNHVSFVTIEDEILNKLNKMNTFFTHNDIDIFCLEKKDMLCLPDTNLINNIDNEEFYFTKMADELLRYQRVQLFMLNSNEYMNISNTDYHIHDDELFLLQSILFGDYFNQLQPQKNNKYVKNIDYDVAKPANVSEAIVQSNNIQI